jgi:hypothetical protein
MSAATPLLLHPSTPTFCLCHNLNRTEWCDAHCHVGPLVCWAVLDILQIEAVIVVNTLEGFVSRQTRQVGRQVAHRRQDVNMHNFTTCC